MLKRPLTALLIGTSILIAGCGSSSAATVAGCPEPAATPSKKVAPPPRTDLLKAGTLTVGSAVKDPYPPQEFYPLGCGANEADGFDIDMGKSLAAHMGLGFAVADTPSNGLAAALQAKKFDVLISAMTIQSQAAKGVSLEPYFMAGESFVVTSKSRKSPKQIADLCGLKVGVEKGTAEESDANDANDPAANGPCAKNPIKLKDYAYNTDTEALAALRKGTIDVHFTDSAVAGYELLKNADLKVTNPAPINASAEGIGTRPGDTAMANAVHAAFEATKQDGTYKKLLAKWRLSDGDIMTARPAP